ncbi:MAG: hypothetical protein ABIT37_07695 [Luteolibacter sp.]
MIRLSEAARSCLGDEALAVRQRFDVPARLRASLRKHPTGWLMGSLASGLAASLLFFRGGKTAKPEKRRGLPTVLLGLTLTAVRPLAKVWLTNQVKHHLVGRFSSTSSNPPADSRSQSPHSI